MSTRSILTSALALSLALSPAATASFALPVDPSWNLEHEEAPDYRPEGIDGIQNVVVIYGENRSFDNLYGLYPGADGIAHALETNGCKQRDRDGTVMKVLPPIWGGLPGWAEGRTANLPNEPFAIDDPEGFAVPPSVATRDLVHKFYQNQMQINGGANDKFAAWSDAGGLTMSYYAGAASQLPMWKVAQHNVLADNFFFGAFGGSFLNHHYLICACVPVQANPNDTSVSAVDADGVTLTANATGPASALSGAPAFVLDGRQTPDRYAVNTTQPPFQPSFVKPPAGGDNRYADPGNPHTLSAQPASQVTIGDLLPAANVSWAWYAGAWQDTLDNPSHIYAGPYRFQPHHAPFNYYANYAPGTQARADHLKDGGVGGASFIADIDAGKLPAVTFYKPQGTQNEHPGYADVLAGDQHIADVISHLQRGPQWQHMLVIVTYDENGGLWDHAAPPKGDRWGPGSRVPTIIVSPFSKAGTVDHTPYDTSSILRFIVKRFLGTVQKPVYPGDLLPGLALRDRSLKANGFRRPGDLTNALKLDGENRRSADRSRSE